MPPVRVQYVFPCLAVLRVCGIQFQCFVSRVGRHGAIIPRPDHFYKAAIEVGAVAHDPPES